MSEFLGRMNIDPGSALGIGQNILKIIAVIIGIRMAIKLAGIIIDKFFNRRLNGKIKLDVKKVNTMSTIIRSAVTYTLYFVGLTMIISIMGISPASIITAAGIGGLAIGFGAQNLVKDVITGFFILLEEQYEVGDYITVDKYSGIVEEIGIRITKLRDFSGDLHIIPNGAISNVTNHSNGDKRIMFNVEISYDEDVDKAIGVMEAYFKKYRDSETKLTQGPKVLGVREIGDSSVKLMVWATSEPMEQWRIERDLKKGIKKAFDEAGIEIPYPKYVVYHK
jgi:small-conductance mechanosensitive channel